MHIKAIQAQNIFLLFFSLIFFSVSLPAGFAGFNIDASWHEALVIAIDKRFVFGKDFIFNYGPLGYLNTGLLPKSVSIWILVLVEVFTLFNYLIIIRLCFQKAQENWWIVAISALLIFLPWGFIADTSFTLFYFFLFWLLYAQKSKNSIALILAVILSALIFYIKVNLSIIVYGLFYLSLIYFWFNKYFSFRILITSFFAQTLLTFALSFLLHVDIPAYLEASLKIIDAYQDAMAAMLLTPEQLLPLLIFEALIVIAVLIFIFKHFSSLFQKKFEQLYLYLLIALAWFLCFKQAHTAISVYNVFGFFLFMPPLAVLIYLFTEKKYTNTAGKLVLAILFLQLMATQLLRFYIGNKTFQGYLLTYPPSNVSQKLEKEDFSLKIIANILAEKNPYNYLKRLINYSYDDNFKDLPIELPTNLLNKIGNASVDIVPHQVSHIYFSQLNYNPRPVIQSYQANSSWLMKKNGDKYMSNSAPNFVLFRTDAFREQNPFWVETDLSEALLRHYDLIDTSLIAKDTFFVFQQNKLIKSTQTRLIQDIRFKLNEEIEVPNSENPIRFIANIQYSLKGKIARLFFQPPYLYCSVTYQNGQKENFRVIDKILKGGIFINRKITTQNEVGKFFNKKNTDNQRVIKIKFWSQHQSGFANVFEGSFKELKITK